MDALYLYHTPARVALVSCTCTYNTNSISGDIAALACYAFTKRLLIAKELTAARGDGAKGEQGTRGDGWEVELVLYS